MKSSEAGIWAEFAACIVRPRSPMMTVSGIAVWGLSPAVIMRRIAAESVSPQLLAVFGRDTEFSFATTPVIRISVFDFLFAKV